jgi:hypothetical protein
VHVFMVGLVAVLATGGWALLRLEPAPDVVTAS